MSMSPNMSRAGSRIFQGKGLISLLLAGSINVIAYRRRKRAAGARGSQF